MRINLNPKVNEKYSSYPLVVRHKIEYLRSLILEVANQIEVEEIEETLKWGEPSFLAKNGSTIRIDWKSKNPNQYAMYFKCTSKLVETFREVYGDLFEYEKNRAILFNIDDQIPDKELKSCIKAALMYHSVKSLSLLGIQSI